MTKEMQDISTMIYEQAAQQQAEGEKTQEESKDENVVDAEYEVVDEDKET